MSTPNPSPRQQGWLTIAGVLLVTVATGLGIGYGQRVAQQFTQAQEPTGQAKTTRQDNASTAGKVTNASAVDPGEVILAPPRYAKPPELFDPIAAMAARAASAAALVASPVSPRQGASASKPMPPPPVTPVGWAGTGTVLEQMWEGNARVEWKVRTEPLTAPNWRISGVVQRGQQTQIIVQFDGEVAPRFFKLGDVLPGGAKLAWVQPNVIGAVLEQRDAVAVPVLEGQTQSSTPSKPTPTQSAPTAKP